MKTYRNISISWSEARRLWIFTIQGKTFEAKTAREVMAIIDQILDQQAD